MGKKITACMIGLAAFTVAVIQTAVIIHYMTDIRYTVVAPVIVGLVGLAGWKFLYKPLIHNKIVGGKA